MNNIHDRNVPSISFVCCVKSGILEGATVRMIESLRRWGGAFARAPVYAVTPRYDAPLSRATHENFKRLDVRHLYLACKTPYSWFKYYNKPIALDAADAVADTETIAWLDSDILIVGEPEAFGWRKGSTLPPAHRRRKWVLAVLEIPLSPYGKPIAESWESTLNPCLGL